MKRSLLKHLFFWFFLTVMLFALFTSIQLRLIATDNVRLFVGESHYVNMRLPFIYVRGDRDDIILFNGGTLSQDLQRISAPISFEALELGEVNLEFSLFGRIPLRQITINVLPEVSLVPGGHSIGIKLQSQGVAVVGYYYFNTADSERGISPARDAGVRLGDSILAINGEDVKDMHHASRLLGEAGAGEITLLINRDGRDMNLTVRPAYSVSDGDYRIGLYIRDSAAGVGTLSFYDPQNDSYGALGHVIIDTDTNKPINLSAGSIVKARIIEIRAAQRGQPGEKTGVFIDQESFRGNIEKNTSFGIFGRIEQFPYEESYYYEPIPMALASQVETGPAEILTVIEDDLIRSYAVVIERVAHQSSPSDKGLILRVVDEELLEQTGGIVQGMSGSPIIQNGRLVGAITHVFINEPSRGYGIFIEWMHRESVNLTNN